MSIELLARADDFGSAQAANDAILQALSRGTLIHNVSCMACGTWIAQGAAELAAFAGKADLGLHYTLNAEWDSVKWRPCAPKADIPTLLDETGNFRSSRQALGEVSIDLDQALQEADAQLDRLTALGLPITYLDGHMGPEDMIPGLADALAQWCRKKGLLYARPFYRYAADQPAFGETYETFSAQVDQWLSQLAPGGRYLYVMHPARSGPETMAFTNVRRAPGQVAWEREQEYRSVIDPAWTSRTAQYSIRFLRYRDLAEN